jgi:uroporphyrinogen III methyltransferase/synthase
VGKDLKICCIGPVTAATLGKFGFTPDIMPEDYTIPALVDALVQG